MEHDERWSTGRKYLDMEQLEEGSLEERKVVSLV